MTIKFYSGEYNDSEQTLLWYEEISEYGPITVPSPTKKEGESFERFYPNPRAKRLAISSLTLTYEQGEQGEQVEIPIALGSRSILKKKYEETWDGKYLEKDINVCFTEDDNTGESYGKIHIVYDATGSQSQNIGDEKEFTITVGANKFSVTVEFVSLKEETTDGTEESTEDEETARVVNFYSHYSTAKCNVDLYYYSSNGDKTRLEGFPKDVEYGLTVEIPPVVPPSVFFSQKDTESFVVKNDVSKEITFSRKIKVPLCDDSKTTVAVELLWYHKYPNIDESEIPTVVGRKLSGVYLSDCKIYSGAGEGLIEAKQEELLTLDATALAEKLSARWLEGTGISVNTIDELRDVAGIIPTPFATTRNNLDSIPDDDGGSGEFSFKKGFSDNFHAPVDDGGRVVTRGIVNSIGNIGSQCQFYEQCGGYYSFDRTLSGKIGGYPKNARLKFYDKDSNTIRTVRSLHDDNEFDFTEDKGYITTWSEFKDSTASEATLKADGPHWIYVDDTPEVGVYVDYSDYVDLTSRLIVGSGKADDYEVPFDGFLTVFAIGCLDCDSLRREPGENISFIMDGTTRFFEPNVYNLNGMYATFACGGSYLEVKGAVSGAKSSLLMGLWTQNGCLNWYAFSDGSYIKHFSVTSPLSPFSIGIMVSKGDVISVRNTLISVPSKKLLSSSTFHGYVHSKNFADADFARRYVARYARLFRRGTTI